MRTWNFWRFKEAMEELEAMKRLELVTVFALGSGTMSEEGYRASIKALAHKAGEHKWHKYVDTKKVERSWIEDMRFVLGGSNVKQEVGEGNE